MGTFLLCRRPLIRGTMTAPAVGVVAERSAHATPRPAPVRPPGVPPGRAHPAPVRLEVLAQEVHPALALGVPLSEGVPEARLPGARSAPGERGRAAGRHRAADGARSLDAPLVRPAQDQAAPAG